ncbi:hypothetical protein ACFVAF_38475 [Streptomyces sp. NPDC057596]|uniref:hypothetical protein n=1 Tax=Streptomyces sp. NPDC057596 TaxID=3346178 RepID=UPI0036BB7CA7
MRSTPRPKAFAAPLLSAGSCGWHLDLRSHILFSPDRYESDPDARDFWNATYQHEIAHWIRYQTSSIGLLLVLLQRARAITAQQAIQELPGRTRDQIIQRFRAGHPLWSFASGYDPSVAGAEFALMGQFWLDLRFTYEVLFDFEKLSGIRWHAADAVGSAISDAWRAAESFSGMAMHPGNEIADGLLHGRVRPVVVNGHHLTTRSLWESASTLDELRPKWTPDDNNFSELSKLVRYKLDEPVYGGAWKVANQLCQAGTTPEMFLVVVHIATNPALPYWGSPITRLDWDDLYPPSRFLRIYELIARNMYLHDIVGRGREEDLAQLLELITRQAGVQYADPITHAEPGLDSHPAANQHLVGDLNAVIRSSLYLRHHWSESPSRFILPSTSQAYAMADGGKDEIDRLRLVSSAAEPPLMQFADGLWSGPFFHDRHPAFLLNAWAHNTLDALITGGDPEDQSYLPAQARQDAVLERFRQRYLADNFAAW